MRFSGLIVVGALSILAGCAKAKAPTPPPPPPAVEVTPAAPGSEGKPPQAVYPKQARALPGDIIIKNCTVTHEIGNKADCICRKANTHLDAVDSTKSMLMVCKGKK
jgi:hypothetical protein